MKYEVKLLVDEYKAKGMKHTEALRHALREVYGQVRLLDKDKPELDHWTWICNKLNDEWVVSDRMLITEYPTCTANPWNPIYITDSGRVFMVGTSGEKTSEKYFPYVLNTTLKDTTKVRIGVFQSEGDFSNILEAQLISELHLDKNELIENKKNKIVEFINTVVFSQPRFGGEENAHDKLGQDDFTWWKKIAKQLNGDFEVVATGDAVSLMHSEEQDGEELFITVGTDYQDNGEWVELYLGTPKEKVRTVYVEKLRTDDFEPTKLGTISIADVKSLEDLANKIVRGVNTVLKENPV